MVEKTGASRWLWKRHPAFVRLWAARAISHLGDGAALVALVIHVQGTHRTGIAVSTMLLAQTAPRLLGPIAGALADRVAQRRLMVLAALGQAVVYGAISVTLPPLPVLLALVAAASLFATTSSPAGRSAVASLVPAADLVRANSWMGAALTLQGTLGPAAGGALIAATGIRGALAGNALTFLVSAMFLAGLPALSADRERDPATSMLRETREGIAYASRNGAIRALIVGLAFGVMFAAVDDVALVFLARQELGAGATGYGTLAAVYGVGFAAGTVAFRRVSLARAERAFLLGLLITGIGGLATGLAPVLVAAAASQALAGSGNGLDVVATDTIVQRSVPRSHRGRVFGVVGAATLAGGTIARGVGGIVLDLTSARATFVIGGAGVIAVSAVTFVLLHRADAQAP